MLNRKHAYLPRFPFHSRGRLFIAGLSYDGLVVDISAHACLFAADRSVLAPVGERCRLEVLQGRLALALAVGGEVAHRRDSLLTVGFDASADIEFELAKLVELNLGVLQLTKRELGEDGYLAPPITACPSLKKTPVLS